MAYFNWEDFAKNLDCAFHVFSEKFTGIGIILVHLGKINRAFLIFLNIASKAIKRVVLKIASSFERFSNIKRGRLAAVPLCVLGITVAAIGFLSEMTHAHERIQEVFESLSLESECLSDLALAQVRVLQGIVQSDFQGACQGLGALCSFCCRKQGVGSLVILTRIFSLHQLLY